MSDEILTDERIRQLVDTSGGHGKGRIGASHIAANAEIARLRAELEEKERVIGAVRAFREAVTLAITAADSAGKTMVTLPFVRMLRRRLDAALSGQALHREQGEAERDSPKARAGERQQSAQSASPASPVCRWTHVAADKRYPWRTGCGYNTTADPASWGYKCPFPNCLRPITTDREEG